MIPIILCGGSGARLWPLPKKKPFYNFFGQYNLLDRCLKRLESFKPSLIVSVDDFKPDIEETLKDKKYKTKIIYEPETKNTAAPIALACHLINKREQDKEVVGIFPSDHFIGQELEFQKYLSLGIQMAKEEHQIVTFGIPPSAPSSSYGYIKAKETYKKITQIAVKKGTEFVEKPKISKSSSFLQEGYLWNSGIFLSPLNLLIQYFENFLPALWKEILRIESHSISPIYKNLKPISFDKGIMEKIDRYLCLPCHVDWADLGSWDRIADWDQKFPGRLNNKVKKQEKNSEGNFIFSPENKFIGLIGIKNSLIVNGEEGLLIAKKGQSENVRDINTETQKQKKEWVQKPWGAYRIITREGMFQYKEIKIKAGHQLSYQSHQKRKEHWIVTKGPAEAVIEGQTKKLQTNDHLFVDQKVKHRLKNPTNETVFILEVQIGNYLEEDDIIRYEDDYGRVDPV